MEVWGAPELLAWNGSARASYTNLMRVLQGTAEKGAVVHARRGG